MLVLNREGRFDTAERVCDRLADECGDDVTADANRADIALNRGAWEVTLETASRLAGLYAESNFVVAFAAFELDRHVRILPALLHAASNYPRAARMMLGRPVRAAPQLHKDVRDTNASVALRANLHAYLGVPSRRTRRYFRAALDDPRVARHLDAVLAARQRERRQTRADGDREAFDFPASHGLAGARGRDGAPGSGIRTSLLRAWTQMIKSRRQCA